ncbi:hypothetical protein R3W88_030173 [Solanum pinnatisectum]|uniref:Uncharacterized protein n=1 Tax=Solanum pinnatisectum TaxID=50273 RepID=A0AAV9K7U9_9SOLN|nr:hypothetical protein R3W88_030173 [Solanum pinnatisectum]
MVQKVMVRRIWSISLMIGLALFINSNLELQSSLMLVLIRGGLGTRTVLLEALSLFNRSTIKIGGYSDARYLSEGDALGHDWVPAECDVSIRTGWFWHASEKPKSAMTLLDLYYKSVSR